MTDAQEESLRNPRSPKECAICHYRWIDIFFIDGKGSDLVPYQSEKVVATRDMCFSCHDGSVLDSRARVDNDYGHKTKQPPPSRFKVPKIFPLDEKGNVTCATCHTPHALPSGPATRGSIFLRTSNRNSAMCRMCHADTDGGIDAGNHPVGETKQGVPKTLVSLGSAAGASGRLITCETCHTAHGSPYESLLIMSGKDSGLCVECHREEDNTLSRGKRKPFHLVNVLPGKVTVPEKLIERGARLGRRNEVICQTCHKVHNNKTRQELLIVRQDMHSSLCLTCHREKQYVVDTKHNLIHSAPEEKNLQGETVADKGVCSACHLAHKAARSVDETGNFATGLCRSCHSKGSVGENPWLNGYSHPLNVRPTAKEHRNAAGAAQRIGMEGPTLPLFAESGIEDKGGTLACPTCHDPHRWQAASTAGETRKEVKGNRMTSFLRRTSPEICQDCHAENFLVAGSKHDLGKVAPEEKNIKNLIPFQSGLCGACHLVHGGQKYFLWARGEVTYKGTSIVQDLCTSCHNEKGMAKDKVIKGFSHPLNVSPVEKGFKTTLPLFDEHDKADEDGVMRCHTCHDTHASTPWALGHNRPDIGKDAKDGFLRLEYLPSPILCKDCHGDKGYIEKTEHDLTVTAPLSKNMIGQLPSQSGVCGACHAVHGGKNKTRLWAQTFGTGNNIMEMMCNGCHSAQGSAKDKIPRIASHPEHVLIMNLRPDIEDQPDYFPLFDKRSGGQVKVGDMSCPSCHEAHIWDPESPAPGKGINVEGDATNSFLRARARDLPCKNCHGPDGLFKLLYFHEPRKPA